MATLMDFIMAQRGMPEGSPDYTLGSRANLQPTRSPFSPDGRLGNMGARNMMNAQQGLANSYMPAQTGTTPPQQLFDVLSSYGAGAPMSQPPVAMPQPNARVPIPQQLFDVLSSYGAGAPMSQPPMPVRQMDSTLFGEDVGARPMPMRAMDSTLAGYDMPPNVATRRPSMPMAPAGAPMQLGSAAPSVRESFMQRLLSGPNYQSNSMPVVPQGGAQSVRDINFADPDNAADFFRAERALRALPEETLRMAGLLG
jgi:hypothetical protein